ncbi:glycosyltransferase family 4 protein [Lactococcus protaetiae]|uniref:Glycosyltransferase family 4 protein n=1 Tax=Lactococcus protaetiae TaxID=2592653 RepID=A0A514Z663_9LACT|nr:glycosyltransferase family 4 protein [Lactococcus protaetiae]QDK70066.1 glycosyltransferase family 4 protein [Lactococcus protaetiae]
MRVGLFTDSYFPQISGVATSIQTLAVELEKLGHEVFIFTTTDPNADVDHEKNIIRLQSIPFVSLAERKIVLKGVFAAYQIAKEYDLDIIHTQTEFGMGILGKMVAVQLRIPVIHTLHTKYEDYVYYIAKGRLIRPSMVKYIIRNFLRGTEAIICPSEMVLETVNGYGVTLPKRVIPTGIEIERFKREDITAEDTLKLRDKLGIKKDEIMLLSLSRIAAEKNIQAVIHALPDILTEFPVKLVIVGHGPYADTLKALVSDLNLDDIVIFTGRVENEQTAYYYKAADFFISASTSETQGLTYLEALAAGTRVIAAKNPYLNTLINDVEFGRLFDGENDIAEQTCEAIAHKHPIDKFKFEKKLYEISAEHFAKQVYLFYLDTIIEYDTLKSIESDRLPMKIEDAIRQMPLTVKHSIKREQIRAKYFARKASKLAKNLQSYVKIDKDKEQD